MNGICDSCKKPSEMLTKLHEGSQICSNCYNEYSNAIEEDDAQNKR